MIEKAVLVAPSDKLTPHLIELITKGANSDIDVYSSFSSFESENKEKYSDIVLACYFEDGDRFEQFCDFSARYAGKCLLVPLFDADNRRSIPETVRMGVETIIVLELNKASEDLDFFLKKYNFLSHRQKEILLMRLRSKTLTQREIEVARLVAQGATAQDCAAALGLSPRTIEVHKKNLVSKMACPSMSTVMSFMPFLFVGDDAKN